MPASSGKRVYARVTGTVQGVGFRYFTQRKASRLGLVGYVRNMPNGSVELEVEGERDVVDAFLDSVRAGPPGSRIMDFYTDARPIQKTIDEFEIRY